MGVDLGAVAGEHGEHALHGVGVERAGGVDAVAEAGDVGVADELVHGPGVGVDVGDEQARGVGPDVDDGDAHGRRDAEGAGRARVPLARAPASAQSALCVSLLEHKERRGVEQSGSSSGS